MVCDYHGMPAYIGGPAWPDLDAAFTRRDFPAALALAERDTSVEVAERQLVIGICRVMFNQSEQAVAALVESIQAFGVQRPARAAVAAVFLGRLHYFGHDSPSVANGWFARARRLVEDRPDCIEHVLATLPLPGCDIVDVTQLHTDATRALTWLTGSATQTSRPSALADLGTAQVSRGFVSEGMTLLDEAMAMVLAGEASSPFAAIEVVCNLLSSCARVGDLGRADQWTRAADRHLGLGIDQGPAFLYAHCRTNLGLILCDVGRWDDAEVTLRLASSRTTQAGPRVDGQVRAALAELWVLQGRLDDAERLLSGRHDHQDSILPLAGLHLARGAWVEAAAVARRGIRLMGEDRMRVLPATCDLRRSRAGFRAPGAGTRWTPTSWPRSPWTTTYPCCRLAPTSLVAGWPRQAARFAEAVASYQAGLRLLADDDWPLLRAELHLSLGRLLADTEAPAAIAETRPPTSPMNGSAHRWPAKAQTCSVPWASQPLCARAVTTPLLR